MVWKGGVGKGGKSRIKRVSALRPERKGPLIWDVWKKKKESVGR